MTLKPSSRRTVEERCPEIESNYSPLLDPGLRRGDGRVGLLASLCLIFFAACSGPNPPIDPEPEKPEFSLVVSADLLAVDLVVNSPITLSTVQAIISFDPAQIQLSNATQGSDGPRISNVFDDGGRIPGKFLVGLADVNQNPLPRSGAIVRVPLTNSSPGDVLRLESVTAVDIFGNKTEVEVVGSVPIE